MILQLLSPHKARDYAVTVVMPPSGCTTLAVQSKHRQLQWRGTSKGMREAS